MPVKDCRDEPWITRLGLGLRPESRTQYLRVWQNCELCGQNCELYILEYYEHMLILISGMKHNQVTWEIIFFFNLNNFRSMLLIPQEHASMYNVIF